MNSPVPSPTSADCDVVIVNWNAGNQLIDCLHALNQCDTSGFVLREVIIVDNASTDGSTEAGEALALKFSLIVLRNKQNRGFAAACNQGARESKANYLLFLNPDTRVEPEAIACAIGFMQNGENANTAVCGAQLADASGAISRTCARCPSPRHFAVQMLGLDKIAPGWFRTHLMTEWDHQTTQRVDHVMGAFYLIRRAEFEAFHGFDERFFVYLEDLDLSARLRSAGREIVYLTTARAYHKGGGSSEQVKAARLFYALQSRILYGYKHFPLVSATLLLLGTLLIEPPIRVLVSLLQGSGRNAWNTICGITRLWRALPTLRRNNTHPPGSRTSL